MNTRIEKTIGILDDKLYIDIEYKPWDTVSPVSVMVSRNEFQWSGFGLRSRDELVGLRDALNEYIWSEGWE